MSLEVLRLHHWQHHAKAEAIECPEGRNHEDGFATCQDTVGEGPSKNTGANHLWKIKLRMPLC